MPISPRIRQVFMLSLVFTYAFVVAMPRELCVRMLECVGESGGGSTVRRALSLGC